MGGEIQNHIHTLEFLYPSFISKYPKQVNILFDPLLFKLILGVDFKMLISEFVVVRIHFTFGSKTAITPLTGNQFIYLDHVDLRINYYVLK